MLEIYSKPFWNTYQNRALLPKQKWTIKQKAAILQIERDDADSGGKATFVDSSAMREQFG